MRAPRPSRDGHELRANPAPHSAATPWALPMFRLWCGLPLMLYFANHYLTTVDLIAYHGLYDLESLRAFGVPVRSVAWLTRRSPEQLRFLFLIAIGLAALGAAGVLPRLCSASLFIIALSSSRAVLPISYLDDYLATATLFWLVLLPSPAENAFTRRFWRFPIAKEAPESVEWVFLGYVLLLYVTLGLGLLTSATPGWPGNRPPLFVCCLLPAFVVAPGRWPKLAGALLQVGLHSYLIVTTELVVSHLLMMATGFVLWTRALARTSTAPQTLHLRATLPAVVGLTYVTLLGLVQPLASLIPQASRARMALFLLDAGLLPSTPTHDRQASAPVLVLQLPGAPDVRVRPDNARIRLLFDELSSAVDRPESHSQHDAFAARFLRGYCTRDRGLHAGSMAIVSEQQVRRRWSFTCSPGTHLPATVPL
jgi:hypothetical protein